MKFSVLVCGVFVGTIVVSCIGAPTPRTPRRPSSDYDEYSCPRRCNEAYYPLCGINKAGDTKMFVNDCYMSMENCNQLPSQVYNATEDTDCPDFDEWISDDGDSRRKN